MEKTPESEGLISDISARQRMPKKEVRRLLNKLNVAEKEYQNFLPYDTSASIADCIKRSDLYNEISRLRGLLWDAHGRA